MKYKNRNYVVLVSIVYILTSSMIFAYSVSPRPIKDAFYYTIIQGIFAVLSYFAIRKRLSCIVIPYIIGYVLIGTVIIRNFAILHTEALRLVLFLWCIITVGMLSIDIGLRSCFSNRYLKWLLFSILYIFLLFPLSILSYNIIFNEHISTETFLPILQSDFIESIGFLYGNIPYKYYWILIITGVILYLLQKKYICSTLLSKKASYGFLLFGVVVLSVVAVTRGVQRLDPVVLTFKDAYQTYYSKPTEYIMARESTIQNTKIEPYNGTGLYVIIVGESAVRDALSVYGYYRDTTPFLNSKKDSSQYIILNNVYSPSIQTEDSLMYALSNMSQYNGIAYEEAISLIDTLNTAGIRTVWLSNQGKSRRDADIKVRSFSKFAKEEIFATTHSRWATDDGIMLPLLQKLLMEYQKSPCATVLFIHLYGSHGPFCAGKTRKRSTYFTDIPRVDNKNASIDSIRCYDNSIRATDSLLQSVTAMVEREKDFKALLYFSDHGEGVYRGAGRVSGQFAFDLARIPMYIYFSKTYMEAHKARINTLRNNINRGFTTDMLYDTILGTIGIKASSYSQKQDIGSLEYHFTKESLKTLKGTISVSDDKQWLVLE